MKKLMMLIIAAVMALLPLTAVAANSSVLPADGDDNLLVAKFTTDKAYKAYYEQNFDSTEGMADWTAGDGWTLKNKNFSQIDSSDKTSIFVGYNDGSGTTNLTSPEILIKDASQVEFYAYFGAIYLVWGKWTLSVVDVETSESTEIFNAFNWAQETAYNVTTWNKFTFSLSEYAGKKVKFVFSYEFGGEDLAIDEFRVLSADADSEETIHIFEGEKISFMNLSEGNPESYQWSLPGADEESSTEENPVATYSKAGTYSVSLTVKRGDDAASTTLHDFVVVSMKTPEALIGLPEEGYESPFVGVLVPVNVPVKFRDLSTGNPSEWTWVFQNADVETSHEQNPTVSFVKKGTVSVGLTAKNSAGQSNDILQYAIQAGGAQYVWNIAPEETTKLAKVDMGWYGSYAGSNWLAIDKFAEKYKAPLADCTIDSVGVYFASTAALDADAELTLTVNAVGDNGAPGEVLATSTKKMSELKYSDEDYLRTDFTFASPVSLKKGQPFFVVVGPFPNGTMEEYPYTGDDVSIFCVRRGEGEKTTSWQYLEEQDQDTGEGTGVYKWYENTDDPISMAIAPVINYEPEAGAVQGVKRGEADATVVAIYTIDGIEVSAMQPGNFYIVKYSDGTSRKVIMK